MASLLGVGVVAGPWERGEGERGQETRVFDSAMTRVVVVVINELRVILPY